MNNNKLPPEIYKRLNKKGYFNLTKDERIESNKRCFQKLLSSSKGDPKAERDALLDWRGDHN